MFDNHQYFKYKRPINKNHFVIIFDVYVYNILDILIAPDAYNSNNIEEIFFSSESIRLNNSVDLLLSACYCIFCYNSSSIFQKTHNVNK